MKRSLAIAAAMVLTAVSPGFAHRLDEYLQATTLLVSNERLRLEMRLAPGVAVATSVLDSIDGNRDGAISDVEQASYGRQVVGDVSLTLDGARVPLRLVSSKFASVGELRGGVGEIGLVLEADLPAGGPHRRLVFENHHRSRIAAYLVNSLVPREPDIRITNQTRDYRQSVYELTYEGPASAASASVDVVVRWGLLVGAIAVACAYWLTLLRRVTGEGVSPRIQHVRS